MVNRKDIIAYAFYLGVSFGVFTETGISTACAICFLLFMSHFRGIYLGGLQELMVSCKEKIEDIIDFENEFVIPRLEELNENSRKKVMKKIKPINDKVH